MATKEEHRAKWQHNRRFLATIQAPQYSDWMATVAFYAAVHCVEVLLAKDGISHPMTHEGRNECLKRQNRYKKIWENYRPLYEASIVARYLSFQSQKHPSFDQWITPEQVRTQLIDTYLRQIEASVSKLLA